VLLPEIASDVPEMPAGPASPARGSERILLVDDEEMLLHAVGMMLRSLGYTVRMTQNPHDALARIERNPAVALRRILDGPAGV
jgi:CheY-like chemotaxis protein